MATSLIPKHEEIFMSKVSQEANAQKATPEMKGKPGDGKSMLSIRVDPKIAHRIRAAAALEGKQVGEWCSTFLAEHATKTLRDMGVTTV